MKQSLTKRVISMLITVSMLLTMVPSVFAANPEQFKDFPKGWSKVAMEFSVDNGLLNGKSANTIEPQSNLTRAEMATIINRAFGAKITKDISAYTDVDKSDWYYTEMQKAVNMQTFQGDGNGKLRPDDAITREEVMAVIARAIVLETDDYSSISKFKDYSSVSDWAKPYVAVLIANGYVNGYEDNTIKPKANITREEFAQLMYNIFKTYLSAKDTSYTSVYDKNCVMINNEGINLSNVTIDGDLVLGDGVGTSKINLTNVTIKGRLLARGGIITLKNVTTGKGVVVKNVNGTTHFNNYRTDAVFNGVVEHTYTTYLTPSFSTGGGKPGQVVTMYDLTINYWYRVVATGTYVKTDVVNKRFSYGHKYNLKPSVETGFVFDKDASDVETDNEEITVTGNREINLYYNALVWVEFNHPTKGYKKDQIPYGTSVEDAYKLAYKDDNIKLDPTVTIDGNQYDVEWTKNGDLIDPSKETIKAADGIIDYTLKATVNVIYDNGTPNGIFKVVVNPATLEYKLSTVLSTTPSKEHYDFAGWMDEQGNVIDINKPTKVSPLNIKAKWVAKKYELVLETNGGTIDPNYGELDKYTYGAGKTLPDATYMSKTDGSTFAGWYDNPSFDGDPVVTIPDDAYGTKTYYAKWNAPSVVTFEVTFDVNGNDVFDAGIDYVVNVVKNQPVSKPANDPVKDGWKFKYWTVDGVNEYNFASLVTGPMTIKAVFTKIHTVTFVYGNGQANVIKKVLDGDKVEKPQDPSWTGHEFKFWTADGTTAFDFNTAITGDMTISAKWTGINTVTFVYGNGQANHVEYVLDGDKVAKPQDPSWEDNRFDFWTLDGVNAFDFDTAITDDITLTAKWTKIHTVTFVYGNGQTNVIEKVIDGEKVAKPQDPTWTGHKFLFWSADGVNSFDFNTSITGDMTITAKWTGVHTVTFVYGNGQANTVSSVLTNETATKPADPTWAPNTFKFWSLDGVTEYDFATPVTGNITLTAVWDMYVAPNEYTVTFVYGNGDPNGTQIVVDGDKATKPEDPTWEGYTFKFWSLDGVTEYDFDKPVNGDITLTAVWELIDTTVVHTVKFYAGAKDTNSKVYVGKIENVIDGCVIDADYDSFINKINDLYLVITAEDDDQTYSYDLLRVGTDFSNKIYGMALNGYYDEEISKNHIIYPEFVYESNGEWKVFNHKTPVTSDMDIYAVTKHADIDILGEILGKDLSKMPGGGVKLGTPYNSTVRLMDSLKDALYRSRGSFNAAETELELTKTLLTKIAPKVKIIDEDGFIKNFEFSMKIADVISTENIEKQIYTYMNNIFINGTSEEIEDFVFYYLTDIKDFCESNGLATENADLNTVVDFIIDHRDNIVFIDGMINMIKSHDYYINFIDCFRGKYDMYNVSAIDIHFALAVGDEVYNYNFDRALQLLGGGPVYEIINKLGKDKFEDIYNESRDDFNDGIRKIKAEIDADKNYSEGYTMSLKLKINFVELIKEYYTKLHDNVQEKLEDKVPYYNQNMYLTDFVDKINVDRYLGYDASMVSTSNSGYYIKSFMDYYDIMYNNLVLLDKAILCYGADAPEELLNVRDDIANDVLAFINRIQALLEGLDEGGELVGGYTLSDIISRVDSLKELGNKVPVAGIEPIIDNICTILSKLENGEVIAKGYTMDDLVELSERLDVAIKAIRDEDYDVVDKELADIINKVVSKVDEIIKELDTEGTILGKITLDDLAGKIDAINNIYTKFEGKIDALISKLATMNPGNVGDKVDTEYWEDVIFGTDYENRFNLDDVFDLSAKVLDKIRDDNPDNDGTMLIIDPYKISAGSSTVTITRYMK